MLIRILCFLLQIPSLNSFSFVTAFLFRGGKGNNYFYPTKTLIKIIKVFSNFFSINHPALKPNLDL